MRAAGPDDHGGIRRAEIRPLPREATELSCVVLKEDAVLAPRRTALDQLEDASTQRMKGMRDSKGLGRTAPRRCN